MLPAINFDDNIFFRTNKIDNKRTCRMLPPEFPAA